MRKPSRMPFFTQAFTRQPVVADGVRLGGADLARVQRSLEMRRTGAKCSSVYVGRLVVEQAFDLSLQRARSSAAVRRRRARFRSSPDSSALGRHQRQAPDRLEQAHQRHRGLHRNRVRFDEVDVHQRQVLALDRARGGEIAAQAGCASCVISAGISFDATEMMPRPPSAISGIVMASSPEST